MTRSVFVGLVLVAAPCAAGEPVPRARLGLEVGPAFVHYSERNNCSDIDGSSTTTGFAARADGALRVAEDLEATLGAALLRSLEGDMEWRYQGETFQENHFRAEWVEGGPGLAWRVRSRDGTALWLAMAYRLTWERLHILDVPIGDGTELDATEQLLVHAFPLGGSFVWGSPSARLAVALRGGPTFARMTNDQFGGVVFHSRGFMLDAGPEIGWCAGPGWLTFGLSLDVRWHAGSDFQEATFQGVQVDAIWPSNTTLVLLGSVGFAADWPR